MAKNVTRWSPDTCDCVIEYEWDTDAPPESLVLNFRNLVKSCPYHSSLSGEEIFQEVTSENTRKNMVFAEAQKILPSLTDEKGDPKTEDYNWSFDEKRKLKVGFLNISVKPAEKAQLKAACDTKFGAGKVEVI